MARYAIDPSGVMAAFGQLGQSRALLQQRNDIETERVRRQRQQRATEALSLVGAAVGFGLGGPPGASLGMTVGAGVAGAAGGEHIPPSQLLSMGLQAYGLYENAQTKAGNADVNKAQIGMARDSLMAQQQQLQEMITSGQAAGAGDQVSPVLNGINAKIATLDKIEKAGNLDSINPASIGALLARMTPTKADLIQQAPGARLYDPARGQYVGQPNPAKGADQLYTVVSDKGRISGIPFSEVAAAREKLGADARLYEVGKEPQPSTAPPKFINTVEMVDGKAWQVYQRWDPAEDKLVEISRVPLDKLTAAKTKGGQESPQAIKAMLLRKQMTIDPDTSKPYRLTKAEQDALDYLAPVDPIRGGVVGEATGKGSAAAVQRMGAESATTDFSKMTNEQLGKVNTATLSAADKIVLDAELKKRGF